MRALAVLPTYNEAGTVVSVVTRLLATVDWVDVLVVDDASPDGTGLLAADLAADHARVHTLHRPRKLGLGSAYVDGLTWGVRRGYEAVCELDADASHDPADVARLLHTLRGSDVAIGSRYVPGGAVVNWPAPRRLLSRAGNRYVRACTGLPLADATSGLRAYRRIVLEEVDVGAVRSEGYAFQVELALRSWRAGFRIVEVPIVFTERRVGASKMSRGIVVEAAWRVALWGLTGSREEPVPHRRSLAHR